MGFTVTVVYDNETLDESLATDWGFAAVVKDSRGAMLLFDTGADGDILERNMRLLNIDPQGPCRRTLDDPCEVPAGDVLRPSRTAAWPFT
jgi:hypothetical protein